MVRIAKCKGKNIMSIRYEAVQRVAVSFVAAFALTVFLFSSTVTLAPIA